MKKMKRRCGYASVVFIITFSIFMVPVFCVAQDTVKLAWAKNTESDLAGYKLYYSQLPGPPYNGTGANQGDSPITIPLTELSDPENPQFEITGLTGYNTYFVITAYDNEEPFNESGYSNQVQLRESSAVFEIATGNPTKLSLLDVYGIHTEGGLASFDSIKPPQTVVDLQFEEDVIIKISSFHKSQYHGFVVVGKNSGTVSMVRNLPTGRIGEFENSRTVWLANPGMPVEEVVILDFNNDDLDDICLINFTVGRMQVHLNIGGTHFSPTFVQGTHTTKGNLWTFTPGGAFTSATAGDFNGHDGDEIALHSGSTRKVIVWEGDGTKFLDHTLWGHGGSPQSFIVGINYDGSSTCGILFVNLSGGAFAGFQSFGDRFADTPDHVKKFTPGVFTNIIVKDFIWDNDLRNKQEFALHCQDNGNLVVFEFNKDNLQFESQQIWLNTTGKLL